MKYFKEYKSIEEDKIVKDSLQEAYLNMLNSENLDESIDVKEAERLIRKWVENAKSLNLTYEQLESKNRLSVLGDLSGIIEDGDLIGDKSLNPSNIEIISKSLVDRLKKHQKIINDIKKTFSGYRTDDFNEIQKKFKDTSVIKGLKRIVKGQ